MTDIVYVRVHMFVHVYKEERVLGTKSEGTKFFLKDGTLAF